MAHIQCAVVLIFAAFTQQKLKTHLNGTSRWNSAMQSTFVTKDVLFSTLHCHICEKIWRELNLAVWQIVENRQIKFSTIVKQDVIRNTHAHILKTATQPCFRNVQFLARSV